MSHAELDSKLDRMAADLAGFERKVKRLIARLDREGVSQEISDPATWRKRAPPESGTAQRVPLSHQFRREVESIRILDRAEEGRLARRIEFARLRLDKALRDAGVSKDSLERDELFRGDLNGGADEDCALPGPVCRRWLELHALRCEMVERNLYLVLINVERYSHTTASPADLIQEGSAALFRATDGFDWKRGLLFRTYAVHWLNQAFRSYLYNFNATVRVPVYLQKALKHINDAKLRLGDANASVEALARETQLGEGLVEAALGAARSSRSLDVSFDDEEEGGRLKDLLQDFTGADPYTPEIEAISLQESLGRALGGLSERERFVVRQRFGLGLDRERTLSEVAVALGVSLERVRQIQMRAIHKLRTPSFRREVDPFLN